MDLIVRSNVCLNGQISVPGDKSISHRVAIIASLSEGTTFITGFLEGQDCLATLNVMKALGVTIEHVDPQTIKIQGVGLSGLSEPYGPLDCGNAGTLMRLVAGVLAAQNFTSTLVGDESLSKRPMERIILPLRQMGAHITGIQKENKICAPLTIKGKPLHGIEYTLPVESAQIKSCLLFAGLYAQNKTIIHEKGECRDHTERLLRAFGCDIDIEHNRITLTPGTPLKGQSVQIPGDISSAAFFIATASMQKGAQLLVKNVGINPKRIGLIHILRQMGANITFKNHRELNNESVADIEVRGTQLKGITVPTQWAVSAMDEFPIIFIVASCALGETIISGVSELRVKESDRLAVMCQGLKALGISVNELIDGVVIQGGQLTGGTVDSCGDHRVAMAFAMAGFLAQDEIIIKDCMNIFTSFPNFCDLASNVGLNIKTIKEKQ